MIASKIFAYFHLGRKIIRKHKPCAIAFYITQALMFHDLNTIATDVAANIPDTAARSADCPMHDRYSTPGDDCNTDWVSRTLIKVPCTDDEESA